MSKFEFRLPDIGEGLAEAEVAKWLVSVGDRVTEDQPVVEMMTDKASVELPSPGAGVVVEQLAAEGDVVKTGAVLYVLETEARIGASAGHAGAAENREKAPAASAPAVTGAGVLAPPAVRKLARELGVDLASVNGSGPGGRISAEDVHRHAGGPTRPAVAVDLPSTPRAQMGAGARVRLRGVQRRMAETMMQSARTIPHVTGFHELDAGAFAELAARLRREAEGKGARFPFDTLLVRATAIAVHRHPIFNSSLDDERGEIVMHDEVAVGVATATPEGLIVPVVKRAYTLDLEQLAAEVDRVTTAARDGRTSVADVRGGTITISNTGAWRGGHGTSLIVPPEVAIVGFGRIEEKAVVRDGKVVARPMMPMSVTFDHRVIDGEAGLSFALTLRTLIEDPAQLGA
ncbi:MAG: dihydrolipoamide acetyltransferase family protein [Candidatus Dormibacteraceae bacterium]